MRKSIGVAGVLAVMVHGVALLGFVGAYDSHGGDYTWRNQTVIDWLQTPLLAAATVLLFLIAAACRTQAGLSRKRWRMILGLAVTNAAVWWAFVFPIQLRIAAWDANRPPLDWSAVGKLYALGCGAGTLLGVLTCVGLFFALEKDRCP